MSVLNLNVHNVAIVEIPPRSLGKEVLEAGDAIMVSSTLLTHCQAYRMDWEGKFRLRD